MRPFQQVASLRIFASAAAWVLFSTCLACPFCLAPSQTWSEMYAEADIVVLGVLIDSDHGSDTRAPVSTIRIQKVAKGKSWFKKDQLLKLPHPIYSKPGSTILAKGSYQDLRIAGVSDTFATDAEGQAIRTVNAKTQAGPSSKVVTASASKGTEQGTRTRPAGKELVWDFAEPASQAAFDYITAAPDLKASAAVRLTYYLQHLEHEESLIAADAWGEFANSRYEDIVSVKDQFDPDLLKQWIQAADLSPERPALYGMMLGLCGREQDIEFLMQRIGPGETTDFRIGVDGLMGGLLLLAKEDGLEYLVKSRLANSKAPDTEVFSAMAAVKYAWDYEPDLFEKENLRACLRPLLKRETFKELIIADLARWQDWGSIGEIQNLCSTDADSRVVTAAINFCWKVQEAESASEEQKQTAEAVLARVQQSHAKTYKRAARYR